MPFAYEANQPSNACCLRLLCALKHCKPEDELRRNRFDTEREVIEETRPGSVRRKCAILHYFGAPPKNVRNFLWKSNELLMS